MDTSEIDQLAADLGIDDADQIAAAKELSTLLEGAMGAVSRLIDFGAVPQSLVAVIWVAMQHPGAGLEAPASLAAIRPHATALINSQEAPDQEVGEALTSLMHALEIARAASVVMAHITVERVGAFARSVVAGGC